MTDVGPGAREIRLREKDAAFRTMYVATFPSATYILHCLRKKTRKTSTGDIDLAKRRYKELEREIGQ